MQRNRIGVEVGVVISTIVESRTRPEVPIIPIVVVDDTVVTIEVPRVVGIVIGTRTSLLAYVVLTCHIHNKLSILMVGRFSLRSEVRRFRPTDTVSQ